MREFTVLAFDDYITLTSGTWYTSASFNDQLGSADGLVLHAVTTQVSGTSPNLTCQVEHSANGDDWVNVTALVEINGNCVNDGSLVGTRVSLSPPMLRFARIRINFTSGTLPACRLKLHVTGRVSKAPMGATPQAPGASAGMGAMGSAKQEALMRQMQRMKGK